ncbi:MAG TPA: hypothetical protein VEX60_15625 [Pyrinomonadaceae bacterium]|nr:hypothetical protein [Pyrinomonadaceae bacterium]
MSNQPPEGNENLLNFIATTVETMRDQMATKEDLARMATKEDLGALSGQVNSLRDQVDYIGGQLETMRDQMATKSDIARLEDRIEVETTAVRGDIEQVHLRLDSIERAISSRLDHVEAEMSRLRSVVYLLVKDRPDMLRLLGQTPPTGT